jgi:hypothetical protein
MSYEVKFPPNTQFASAATAPAADDQELPRLGRMLDAYLNEPGKPPVRFVLMLPDGGNCRFISNGVGRADLMRLFHDQVRQFLEQVQENKPKPPLQMPDTSNITSLLNPA